MSKASHKRHMDLHKKVKGILMEANGTIVQDDKYMVEINLVTARIGSLRFIMFKNDGKDDVRGSSIYSVFCQLPTKEQVEEFAPQVNLVFGQGVIHVMNPHSGKWNIHHYKAEDVLKELSERMVWLKRKHNDVYSATINA